MSVQELGGASCIALGEADAYRGVQRLPGCQASGGRLPVAALAEPGTEHPGFSPGRHLGSCLVVETEGGDGRGLSSGPWAWSSLLRYA